MYLVHTENNYKNYISLYPANTGRCCFDFGSSTNHVYRAMGDYMLAYGERSLVCYYLKPVDKYRRSGNFRVFKFLFFLTSVRIIIFARFFNSRNCPSREIR